MVRGLELVGVVVVEIASAIMAAGARSCKKHQRVMSSQKRVGHGGRGGVRPDVVAELAKVVVVDRGGREGGRPPAGWSYELVDVPALEVSSSDLRRRVADGAPIWGLVSPGVADVIEAHDLYQELS